MQYACLIISQQCGRLGKQADNKNQCHLHKKYIYPVKFIVYKHYMFCMLSFLVFCFVKGTKSFPKQRCFPILTYTYKLYH